MNIKQTLTVKCRINRKKGKQKTNDECLLFFRTEVSVKRRQSDAPQTWTAVMGFSSNSFGLDAKESNKFSS